jgi:fluoroquinolone resistance protein
MTERYCEGERFTGLSFAGEVFESCDFADCVFVDCSFTKCELDHTTLNECRFVRCEITGLRSVSSSVQSLDFEDCRLQEIEWAPLLSSGAFPDPIHTLKDCSLKYNTFTEMNFNRFDFSNGNEIVGSMFAKCEMQLVNLKGTELHETEFYQCDLRKADFRDATGYKVDILGSRLKDAKFSLPEAVNLLADLKIKLS